MSTTPRPPRVAMVGGFDQANFGDLLFPYLAEHELQARLGTVELDRYSYRALGPEGWLYRVDRIADLSAVVHEYDLVLVGGGQLVRGDPAVGPGYLPTDLRDHHPLSLWLLPALAALLAGVPYAYNAVGVSPTVPSWLRPLANLVIREADYVAVRDAPSAAWLAGDSTDMKLVVVPDTAFAAGALLEREGTAGARELLDATGLASGQYLIVQPSIELAEHRDAVAALVRAAHGRGLAILELPIGPIHGDVPGRLDLDTPTVSLGAWPAPIDLSGIIVQAAAVVGTSYHLGVVAAAAGVPVHRPRGPAGWKYAALEEVGHVHAWEPGAEPVADFERRRAPVDIAERAAQVARHWDRVADLLRARERRNVPVPAAVDAAARLARAVDTALAERDAAVEAEVERRVAEVRAATERELAELRTQLDGARGEAEASGAKLRELRDRRAVRAALRLADARHLLRPGKRVPEQRRLRG